MISERGDDIAPPVIPRVPRFSGLGEGSSSHPLVLDRVQVGLLVDDVESFSSTSIVVITEELYTFSKFISLHIYLSFLLCLFLLLYHILFPIWVSGRMYSGGHGGLNRRYHGPHVRSSEGVRC